MYPSRYAVNQHAARAHNAAPHLAYEDALARTDTTEQAAGVDTAAAAVDGLKISCPGGGGAAPAQALLTSPLPACFPLAVRVSAARQTRSGGLE